MTDEPLIRPVTAGTALVRLSEVLGALKRHSTLLMALPNGILDELQKRREALLTAVEEGSSKSLESTFIAAQTTLQQLHETIFQSSGKAEAAQHLVALGFPDPTQSGEVQPIKISSLLITFSRPKKQVLTTFAFREAAGAMAYWLHEIRFLRDERLEDPIVQSYAPLFQRVRVAPPSEEFSFKVPEPADFD